MPRDVSDSELGPHPAPRARVLSVIARFVLGVALAAVMVVVGTFSYIYLGSRHSKVAVPPEKPTVSTPRAQAVVLPGTLYVNQSGVIYVLSAGGFHQLYDEECR